MICKKKQSNLISNNSFFFCPTCSKKTLSNLSKTDKSRFPGKVSQICQLIFFLKMQTKWLIILFFPCFFANPNTKNVELANFQQKIDQHEKKFEIIFQVCFNFQKKIKN